MACPPLIGLMVQIALCDSLQIKAEKYYGRKDSRLGVLRLSLGYFCRDLYKHADIVALIYINLLTPGACLQCSSLTFLAFIGRLC